MFGNDWLGYFESNRRQDREVPPCIRAEIPEPLCPLLIDSLGHFQLGEAAGGRIHSEIATHSDPALTPSTRRAVQLYIEEEWRHSRELASLVLALGGKLQVQHWTNDAFTFARRILGLRTKLITLAVAEVVGIIYYRTLAEHVGSPTLAQTLTLIADEEALHLDFQAAFFEHAIQCVRPSIRPLYRRTLKLLLLAMLTAGLVVLWLDHGKLLRKLKLGLGTIISGARRELATRRFLSGTGTLTVQFPTRTLCS